jgi:hypothetical protein
LAVISAIYLTQAEHDDVGDLRDGLRARVPPSRASRTLFALTARRLPTTAIDLTQIDIPLAV